MNVSREVAIGDIIRAVEAEGIDGISLIDLTKLMRTKWLERQGAKDAPAVIALVRGLTAQLVRERQLSYQRVDGANRFVVVLHTTTINKRADVEDLLRWTARNTDDDEARQKICIMLSQTLGTNIAWVRSRIQRYEDRIRLPERVET